MNILFTVNTYKPHLDGVQFVTSYLAEGLAARGHRVELITYAVKGAAEEETINGVHVIRRDVRTVHMRHLGDKKGYQSYILSHQNEFDAIINIGTQSALTDWMLPIIKKINVPTILHIHSIWDFKIRNTDKSSVPAFILKLAGNLRWGGYFLKNSGAFKKYSAVVQLHSKDYSVAKFKKWYGIESYILENASDARFFEPCEKEPYIVNVSNYFPMKNQRKLIEIFSKSNIPDNWKLVLVGSEENDYCRSIKEYAQSLFGSESEKRVKILTDISRAETIDIVRQGSIFVSASLREAFPISTIEAMAAKVPFLSYDVGIVKYLPGGLIARSDDEYINALEKLVHDRDYAEKLGSLGYQFAVEHCQIDNKVAELEELIKKTGGKNT